jgi:hypothetical protein
MNDPASSAPDNLTPVDNVARFAAGIKVPRKDQTDDAKLPGMRFVRAFGTQGARWFAQGKTFEEAEKLFDAQHDGILRLAGQIELPRKPAA